MMMDWIDNPNDTKRCEICQLTLDMDDRTPHSQDECMQHLRIQFLSLSSVLTDISDYIDEEFELRQNSVKFYSTSPAVGLPNDKLIAAKLQGRAYEAESIRKRIYDILEDEGMVRAYIPVPEDMVDECNLYSHVFEPKSIEDMLSGPLAPADADIINDIKSELKNIEPSEPPYDSDYDLPS